MSNIASQHWLEMDQTCQFSCAQITAYAILVVCQMPKRPLEIFGSSFGCALSALNKVSCDPRNVGRDMITCQLLNILFSDVTCNSDGSKHVSFRTGMHEVCKYFYMLASGISERKFNDTLRYVLNFGILNREHSTFDNILNGK